MQSGELIVAGKDEARIHLHNHNYPSKVTVCFHDEPNVVPCNLPHIDKLEWDLHISTSHHGKFTLFIKWEVSNVREIKWAVFY